MDPHDGIMLGIFAIDPHDGILLGIFAIDPHDRILDSVPQTGAQFWIRCCLSFGLEVC